MRGGRSAYGELPLHNCRITPVANSTYNVGSHAIGWVCITWDAMGSVELTMYNCRSPTVGLRLWLIRPTTKSICVVAGLPSRKVCSGIVNLATQLEVQ